MGAGADAGIFAVAPVDEIVPALGAGAGVIGDFVGRQAGRRRGVERRRIERDRRVLVGRDELAGAVERGEGRAVLDGELVEREVVGGERQRLAEFRRPALRGLAGTGIDQVEGETGEGRARRLDRLPRGRDVVQAPEGAEVVVVERLDAERDAVDPGGAVAAEALRLDARGIGLERHLGIRRHGPVRRDRVEDRADGRRRHQRRRAPAEEDARHGPARGAVGGGGDLADEGGGVACLVRRLVADVRIEVAVGALRGAERPMDIDAEARLAAHFGSLASANFAKARARCDSVRFRSAVISPNVASLSSGTNIGS